jgi:hypothetical protein
MKQNSKPLNPQEAQQAQQLGISEEQYRKRRDQLLCGTAPADWPPFPLPDIYDEDDPELVSAAMAATSELVRLFESEFPFFGEQLKIAIGVARDVRTAWGCEGLALQDIPLADDLNWPTQRDFILLEQWFVDVRTAITKEIAAWRAKDEGSNAGGAAIPSKTADTPEHKKGTPQSGERDQVERNNNVHEYILRNRVNYQEWREAVHTNTAEPKKKGKSFTAKAIAGGIAQYTKEAKTYNERSIRRTGSWNDWIAPLHRSEIPDSSPFPEKGGGR